MMEMWQTEWCPASRRVRQRLTELGVTYVLRQVPVDRADRLELVAATGTDSIPVLVAGGEAIAGEESILAYLGSHLAESPEAGRHRIKAATARRKELERECQQLATATQ